MNPGNDILGAIHAAWPGAVAYPPGVWPELDQLSPAQSDACLEAGQAGGAYLEAIRQTDLAKLAPVQWDRFVVTIVRGYFAGIESMALRFDSPADQLAAAQADATPPADPVEANDDGDADE